MRIFHSDNGMLMDTLIDHGIDLTCSEGMDIIISDEDAERIDSMVPAICPAAMGDYSIELLPGEYYVVQYDHPSLYLRLDSFPPHTFRWRIIRDTLEEAKAIFDRELSVTTYRTAEAPSDGRAFHLCIDKLNVDEEGEGEYETVLMSEQLFYVEDSL